MSDPRLNVLLQAAGIFFAGIGVGLLIVGSILMFLASSK